MPPLTSDDSVHLLIDGELHLRVSSTPQSRRGNTIYAVGRETTRMIKSEMSQGEISAPVYSEDCWVKGIIVVNVEKTKTNA